MFGNLESQKQVCFAYRVKNREIGAAEIINHAHPPKQKNGKQGEQKTQRREKRGLEPSQLESYSCCKQYITQAPMNPLTHPKKNEQKAKKHKQGKGGSNPLIWRPTAANGTLLIVLL